MKILVTGANGYIGRHVVKSLLAFPSADVTAAGLSTNDVDSRAERIDTDIFNASEDLFARSGNFDCCLHLAWQDGFVHNSKTHVSMLSEHFRFCTDLIDRGVKKLAVMGSMHEIGYHVGAIDENTPCNPISQYGIAKDALRRSLLQYTSDKAIEFQWLRGFYIHGDDSINHSIFTKLLRAAQSGQKTFPFTSGQNKYDFIDIERLGDQIAACLMQDEINGIINCCSGKPVSLAEEVEEFIRIHKLDIVLEYGVFPDRPYDSPEIWGDTTKIDRIMARAKRLSK